MKFKPGQSGNPAGRTKGTRNSAAVLRDKLRALLEKDAEGIYSQAKKMAQAEPAVMTALLDRVLPKLKPVDRELSVPVSGTAGVAENAKSILDALGSGVLTPDEAKTLSDVLAKLHSTTPAGTATFNIHIELS